MSGTEPEPSLRRFRWGRAGAGRSHPELRCGRCPPRGRGLCHRGQAQCGQIHPAQPAGRVRPAIVTPVAGTTRDVVEQAVQLGDVRLNLFDTAGLRQTEDEIEAEGIRRSWKKLEEAGLILAVFDGSERPTREDMELAQRCAVVRPSRWSIKRTSPLGSTQSSSRPILRWCCRSAVRKRGRGRSSRRR